MNHVRINGFWRAAIAQVKNSGRDEKVKNRPMGLASLYKKTETIVHNVDKNKKNSNIPMTVP